MAEEQAGSACDLSSNSPVVNNTLYENYTSFNFTAF
jgi:hypothetical protein